LYHINDYHGAAAPLYLLSKGKTIPCALSLHNAEFQGLWPMRTPKERDEVCRVYNLEPSIVEKYVQFGEVFNLLHAGASYLRIHQRGFGAVGVSNKYGKRSYARYPIFWGLKEVGRLPNPDPSDTAPWEPSQENEEIVVDPAYEASRGDLRVQAQQWAGLEEDPTAELFVFVGRWSNQKVSRSFLLSCPANQIRVLILSPMSSPLFSKSTPRFSLSVSDPSLIFTESSQLSSSER
jgi:alpha-1,3-glucan synthase